VVRGFDKEMVLFLDLFDTDIFLNSYVTVYIGDSRNRNQVLPSDLSIVSSFNILTLTS